MPRPRTNPKRAVELPSSLTQWPGYVMKYVFEAWYAQYERDVAAIGLTVNGLLVLTVVDAEGSATQSRLAERLDIDRSLMVSVIDDLEEKGLVERRRSKHDRRTVPIYVTPLGEKVAAQAREVTDASNDLIFASFTSTERRRFEQLLGKLPDVAYGMRHQPALDAG
jgi:DNA-binding MarR family transcriptional regulator